MKTYFEPYTEYFDEPIAQVVERVEHFYRLMLEANKHQNLTRLVTPDQFIQGHLEDVFALLRTKWLPASLADIGSGVGVPGLLAAALKPSIAWTLIESEKRKAQYLAETAEALGLKVTVIAERAENALKQHPHDTLIARAVSPATRMLRMLKSCSWSTLILYQGPSWAAEREKLQGISHIDEFRYTVGSPIKERILVRLVPRGTSL